MHLSFPPPKKAGEFRKDAAVTDKLMVRKEVRMSQRLSSRQKFNQSNLEEVPTQSGVYVVRNDQGNVQYVGSAGAERLAERLKEHLRDRDIPGADNFQYRTTRSERDARALEDKYRERLKPKYGSR